MNSNKYFQKLAKKLRNKRLETFFDLVENNHMNFHFINVCEDEIKKAEKENDKVKLQLNEEQQEAYLSLYEKNVRELTILMEQLGFNNINFALN